MDAVAISVIAISVVFMIGGLIFANYADKVSQKLQEEELKAKSEKQEKTNNPKGKSK